jgi:hypothetical protein
MLDWLRALGAVDIREELPHADWDIGTRAATTSLTWHYNGPAVPVNRQHGAGLIAQLKADAAWQMQPGWGGTKNGAPGLMYHLVIDAKGAIYQTSDLSAILWHCGHQDGNGRGLALHFPLGGNQEPTAPQIAAAFRVSDALRARYQIGIRRVLGHLEWKHATLCPGPNLMRHLMAYREGRVPLLLPHSPPAGLRRFQVLTSLKLSALVRQAPHLSAPVAGRMKPGTILYVDTIVEGDAVDGARGWVHMARVENEQADLGFISTTLVREVK